MSTYKQTIVEGKIRHYSVGAIIRKGDKFLIIDNKTYGFAGIAGHVDEGEEPGEAIVREVKEECGASAKNVKLLFTEFFDWNWCKGGVTGHEWNLYECEANGEISADLTESNSIGWYTAEQLKKMKLERVWEYWFKKLNII